VGRPGGSFTGVPGLGAGCSRNVAHGFAFSKRARCFDVNPVGRRRAQFPRATSLALRRVLAPVSGRGHVDNSRALSLFGAPRRPVFEWGRKHVALKKFRRALARPRDKKNTHGGRRFLGTSAELSARAWWYGLHAYAQRGGDSPGRDWPPLGDFGVPDQPLPEFAKQHVAGSLPRQGVPKARRAEKSFRLLQRLELPGSAAEARPRPPRRCAGDSCRFRRKNRSLREHQTQPSARLLEARGASGLCPRDELGAGPPAVCSNNRAPPRLARHGCGPTPA